MNKIIILKGLPASGKSTWAKEQKGYKRINKDDLRAMLDDSQWSKTNERFVIEARNVLIELALLGGKNVIVDDTNFAPIHETKIRELFAERAIIETKFFDAPLDVCISRDSKRPNPVGKRVITDMYNKYLRVEPPKIDYDCQLTDAIICDIDRLWSGREVRIGDDSLVGSQLYPLRWYADASYGRLPQGLYCQEGVVRD